MRMGIPAGGATQEACRKLMTNDAIARKARLERESAFARPGRRAALAVAAALSGLLVLGGCSTFSSSGSSSYPTQSGTGPTNPNPDPNAQRETIFGEDGITLFGGDKKTDQANGIGVNSFLWRASLDTVSFMPLASADPFGGVIITDWYQDPKTPGERFKLTVYIMDRRLRADGLKVAAFRQQKGPDGDWVDAAVKPETATQIENAILVRARQLRINTIEAGDGK